MTLEERLQRVAASEEEVAAFLAALPPDVAETLRRFPRDPDTAIYSIYPSVSLSVPGLTMRRADEILRERFAATLGPPPHAETPIGGLVYAKVPRAVVLTECGHGEHYERFSKAHELGHLWREFVRLRVSRATLSTVLALPCEPDGSPDSPEGPCRADGVYTESETKANSFGSSYLMPRDEVLRLWDKARSEIDFSWWETAQAMCSRFNVSEWAIGYRLWEVGKLKWEQYQLLKRTSMEKADILPSHGYDVSH